MSPTPNVAKTATTPALATCNDSLHVGQLTAGMTVQMPGGPAVIVGITVSRWRFSLKPRHALIFRDVETGAKYFGLFDPDAPLKNNWAIHSANDPRSRAGWSTEQYQAEGAS